ncbi:unnamed protein product [Amaranthus hypochondriacus]
MKMTMRKCNVIVVLLVVLLVFPDMIYCRRISRGGKHMFHGRGQGRKRGATKGKGSETVEIAGSSLPDCSHACGSCSPCRLVMVSFVCAALEEAETCPMAYKCMCKNKSYPVP